MGAFCLAAITILAVELWRRRSLDLAMLFLVACSQFISFALLSLSTGVRPVVVFDDVQLFIRAGSVISAAAGAGFVGAYVARLIRSGGDDQL